MWGSSFADLAKKAAELQEQAASSMVCVCVYVCMWYIDIYLFYVYEFFCVCM